MHIQLIPRHVFRYGDVELPYGWSVRVYEDESDSEPVARCEVHAVGRRGIVYSIHGSGFYTAFESFLQQARDLGLETVEGYVSRAHMRLLQRLYGDRVTHTHVGETDLGTRWPWVVVRV